MRIDPPTPDIADAFGLAPSTPYAIPSGQGVTFRLGNTIIKRCDDIEQTEWISGVMESLEENGFRIAHPIRAASGDFVVNGWCATRWIDGTTAIEGRWYEAIEALQAFHRALSRIPFSPLLHQIDNPYQRADAIIWTDPSVELHIGPTADRLCQMLRPINLPSQLIQGDPSEGNLLFTPGYPVGIIDFAPYWHPVDYSIAILIADGIAWSHAPISLLSQVASWPQMDQLLIRAVLFRLYVGYLFRGGEAASEKRGRAYDPVIQAVENWPTRV